MARHANRSLAAALAVAVAISSISAIVTVPSTSANAGLATGQIAELA